MGWICHGKEDSEIIKRVMLNKLEGEREADLEWDDWTVRYWKGFEELVSGELDRNNWRGFLKKVRNPPRVVHVIIMAPPLAGGSIDSYHVLSPGKRKKKPGWLTCFHATLNVSPSWPRAVQHLNVFSLVWGLRVQGYLTLFHQVLLSPTAVPNLCSAVAPET